MTRTCILRAYVVLSFSGVTLVLFCFAFALFLLSLKSRPFVQSCVVLQYTCAPTATRSYIALPASFFVFVSSFFCFFGDVAFSEYFVQLLFSRCMESTSYAFSSRMLLLRLASFFTSTYLKFQSIIQPIIKY